MEWIIMEWIIIVALAINAFFDRLKINDIENEISILEDQVRKLRQNEHTHIK